MITRKSQAELFKQLTQLSSDEIRGIFFEVFGYCSGAKDETFYKALIGALPSHQEDTNDKANQL